LAEIEQVSPTPAVRSATKRPRLDSPLIRIRWTEQAVGNLEEMISSSGMTRRRMPWWSFAGRISL
jgi:hypothetical protein